MPTLSVIDKPASTFFWTAPFADDSEFLPLDPLALDYLGQQVGLWMFPALTTRTSRAQYYCVVLYGLALVESVAPGASDEDRVVLFERWERFWALATLESHGGRMQRGHTDAMRGLRGATKAWKADGALPLDYPLISRQQELGGLGAYLSSLRQYQLVRAGSYKPEPSEIIEAFWGEIDSSTRRVSYEDYARRALDLSAKKIDRKVNNITLATMGERSRLSALVERKRVPQQDRLFERLFTTAKGPTPVLADLIVKANKEKVRQPRAFIDDALSARWGTLDESTRELLDFARRFGNASEATLQAFNDLYSVISNAGWKMDVVDAITRTFDEAKIARLQRVSADLLDGPLTAEFRALPTHAKSFARMAETLRDADAVQATEAILTHHLQVQRERGLGSGWIRRDGDRFFIQVADYSGLRLDATFPSFRINTVQSLLADLGRLS